MVIIGIDPGKTGGIAFYGNGITIFQMPLLPDGSIDCSDLYSKFLMYKDYDKYICFIEKSQPMPKQGVKGVFSYGVTYGLIKGALICAGIPYQEVAPQTWKKYFNPFSRQKQPEWDSDSRSQN